MGGTAELRVLGPVDAWVDGGRVDLGRPQQRCVLAVLAVNAGRVVPTELLVDRVWGDSPPPTARDSLYTHIARLRATLARAGAEDAGVRLLRRSRGYLLQADPDVVDLHRFRRLAGAAAGAGDERAAELLDEALGLWTGAPFADLDNAWLAGLREALDGERAVALQHRTEIALRQGRHADLLVRLPREVAARPLDERLVGQLILALYRGGRQAEALTRYEQLRRRLADELGVDPGPELRALHEQVLRSDPTLLPRPAPAPRPSPPRSTASAEAPAPAGSELPAPAQLPHDVTGFTGREAELALLRASAAADPAGGTVVISAIDGTAGVGKTALAVHFGHQVAAVFPDGQLYADLHGHDPDRAPLSAGDVLGRFLGALGADLLTAPTELDAQAALYRTLLASRRMLVVLDNASSAEQVRPLLPGCPGCVVVVTSRSRLGGLVALDGAAGIALDVLAPADAVTLLGRVLGPRRVAAEPTAAGELARACGFLPLALRIAAANLAGQPDRPIAALVAELAGQDGLAALAVDGDRHAAVRGTFDLSYRALPPAARLLFRRLGLAPGPDVTAAAAAVLAGTSPGPAGQVLRRLADARLVERHRADRYRLHDLIRRYAAERAAAEEPADGGRDAVDDLLRWYARSAGAAARLLHPEFLRLPPEPAGAGRPVAAFADPAEALGWLDGERANLVAAAGQAAASGPYPVAWRLADALSGLFLRGGGPGTEWIGSTRAGLDAAVAAGDEQAEAAMHLNLGLAAWRLGRHQQAIDHHARALAGSRRVGWARGEASSLNNLGNAWWEVGDLARAAEHHTQALAAFRRLGHRYGEAVTLDALGLVCRDRGQLDCAVEHYRRSLEIHRQIGATAAEAGALANLGNAYRELGLFEQAREHLAGALRGYGRTGSSNGLAAVQDFLARTASDTGEHRSALGYAGQAVALARSACDRRVEADALNSLGAACLALDRPADAAGHHRAALAIAGETGNRRSEADALLGLAGVELAAGRPDAARRLAERAATAAAGGGLRLAEEQAAAILTKIAGAAADPHDPVDGSRGTPTRCGEP